MKKTISVMLALVMMLCSMPLSGVVALAQDETRYVDGYALPDKPTDVSASKISPTSVSLTWSMSYSSYYDGFEISSYNSSTEKYTHIAYCNYGKSSYTVKNLSKNKAYTLAVRAYIIVDSKKYYGYNKRVNVRTAPPETSLSSVKYTSAGKVEVKWKKSSSVSGYVIKYSTSKSFKEDGRTCTVVVSGASKTSKTLSGLAKKTYYFKICTYKTAGKKKYMSDYSKVKSCSVKKGVSVKSMLNAVKTDNSAKSIIKEYTDGGVDISKYSSTYDKVKAIYNWHSKHNTDYGWSCVGCNSNFASCISALFRTSSKQYDTFVYLQAGDFQNSDGSKAMHKWSVIYLAGVPYIFDPRLQGYTSDKTGNLYFGVSKGSKLSKKFLYEYDYCTWNGSTDVFVACYVKPATVNIKSVKSGKKSFSVNWNKAKNADGYYVQYSTKSDFSSSKGFYTDKSSLSASVSKLKSSKKYYVRVRAYRQIGNSKYFGFYSTVKSVKTK